MDRTSITPHWPGRPATAWRSPSALGRHPVSDCVEIFKKTPFVAGLHPVSRDVVKDTADIASIPLLTTTLLDQDGSPGEIAGAGRMVAENPTAVKEASKLTDRGSAAGAGLRGIFARPIEFATTGALSLSGGDPENHCYACL